MSFRGLRLVLTLPALIVSACGGGGGPSSPSTPPPDPTYPVPVVVFYDQNGNGLLDPDEPGRLPGVEVVAGSATAMTARGSGRATLQATAGTQTVAIRTETLPPNWVATLGVTVTVPGGPAEIQLPVRLPIGDNQPNVYVAFGDSLTTGVGSASGGGYRAPLQAQLASYFGQAFVVDAGRDGTFSTSGAARIPGVMSRERPAYTLILYGTNDWNDQRCQNLAPSECYTMDNLTTIVEYVKRVSSYPVIATLPPTNPALAPQERTQWNAQLNTLIKAMAQNEGAIVADLFAAFPNTIPGDLPRYFSDDIHPNDQGYALIAQAFLKALGTSRSGAPGPTSFGAESGFGFVRPGGPPAPGSPRPGWGSASASAPLPSRVPTRVN